MRVSFGQKKQPVERWAKDRHFKKEIAMDNTKRCLSLLAMKL